MDAVATAVAYLSAGLGGVPVSADVPRARPEEFVTVERTGGGSTDRLAHPELAVQSWAATNHGAWLLAERVDALMSAMPYRLADVMGCSCSSVYHWPDPDSDMQRYQGVYSLTTPL